VADPIVEKVAEAGDGPPGPPGGFRETQERELSVRVVGGPLDGMRKRMLGELEQPRGSSFSIVCDEGSDLSGDDTAPPPLVYFGSALAF
jgi:hypothetical protein